MAAAPHPVLALTVPGSPLTSAEAAGRSLTYFALGGSGIRALEPLLHLCAVGLGPRQLKVVLVDPDSSNDAVARARGLLDLYRRVREEVARDGAPEDGYFRTEVVDVLGGASQLWSPIADERHSKDTRFATQVDRDLMGRGAAPLGLLFDLLYARPVREMDLTLGFRGVPSIGTVFMNRLREQPFFEQLLREGRAADAIFFAAGSIFGGTGAAALPVVGRALTTPLRLRGGDEVLTAVDRQRVGAALLLPYFTLPAPASHAAPDGGLRPEAAVFAQNAAAALPAYTSPDAGYGGYYVMGDDRPRQQEHNAVGGKDQANRSHYVELYAALAALDFSARGGEREARPVFRIAGVEGNHVRWEDLPIDDASRRRLVGGVVAAHTILTLFRPDGGAHPDLDGRLHGVTWLQTLGIRGAALRGRAALLDALGQFFQRTWTWAGELGASDPALELVRRPGTAASALRHHESVGGRKTGRTLPETTQDGHEIFRHWNVAASRHAKTGLKGFLPVLRDGSERFAAERFGEPVHPS